MTTMLPAHTTPTQSRLRQRLSSLPDLTIEVVMVTPEMAKEWLQLNRLNRPLKRRLVERYARDMARGNWRVNGEPVIFSKSGVLLNGQHRLTAIAEGSVTVALTIVRGVDESTFNTFDSGGGRTTSDVLGVLGERNQSTLTAALRNLWCYREGKAFNSPVSTLTLLDLLEQEPELRESVAWVCGRRWEKHLAPQGVLSFCHHLFQELDPNKAEQFFEQLHTGTMLAKGDPVLTLRRRLFEAEGRLEKAEVIAFVLRAWNAHVQGTKLQVLRLPTDEQGRVVLPEPLAGGAA